jgi:putative effector of murein hydrolase
MFLGVITLFIIAYCKKNRFINFSKTGNTGINIFVVGIILNELLLLIQGLSYMNYVAMRYINEWLLAAAVIMFGGILLMITNVRKNRLPGVSENISVS